jgi:hypothetical protein
MLDKINDAINPYPILLRILPFPSYTIVSFLSKDRQLNVALSQMLANLIPECSSPTFTDKGLRLKTLEHISNITLLLNHYNDSGVTISNFMGTTMISFDDAYSIETTMNDIKEVLTLGFKYYNRSKKINSILT